MLNYVQITGQYTGVDQSPATGTVVFTPNTTCYAPGIPELSPGTPITAQIVAGSLRSASGGTLSLLATDNTLNFTGRTGYLSYQVQETVNGVVFDAWSFTLPYSKYGAGPVDINSLANTTAGSTGIVPPAGDIGGTSSSPTVVSTHLASPLPVAQGGTAAATAAAGLANLGGAAVAGDIGGTSAAPQVTGTHLAAPLPIAQGGTGTATGAPQNDVLAGPATGGAGAPSFRALAAADLPAATTGTQGAVILDGTAGDIQPAGVQAAGAKGQAADAKHVHPFQPWQFLPESYGAKGDGKIITDAVLASNTTLTSATAGFTSADTGKFIMINGGQGSAAIPLITTITYVSATTVTLGTAAAVSGSGYAAVYGTDDTAAINSAVTAAKNYALAGPFFAEVLFGAKIYILATGPSQTGNGASTPTFNAHIPLPYPAANGTTQKLVIALTGAGDDGFFQFWESTTPNLAGSVLVSMPPLPAPSVPDAVFGNQSVIGGPSGSAGFTGGFANVKPVIRGIQVVCPAYTNEYAFDLGYVSAMRIQQSSAHIFAPAGVNGGNGPLLKDLPGQGGFQSKIGAGLRSPVIGNNADVTADDFTVEGYSRGLYLFDHFTAGAVRTIYTDVAVLIDLSQGLSGISHGIRIALLNCEQYNGGIKVNGSTYCPVYVNLDAECPSGPAYDIQDNGNALYGVLHWDDTNSRAVGVQGAANLKVISDRLGPGVWAGAPAAPASGTAQQNTAWRDATVWVTSTAAITAVAVDGTAVFSGSAAAGTPVPVRVPSGHTYTVTSAGGTLTAHWVLD